MTKRISIFAGLLVTLLGVSGVAFEHTAHAQEIHITGPLAGAPAVRGLRQYRVNRIQIQPFVGFTLKDEFQQTMLVGGKLAYHFTDWLGIGVWGGYGAVGFDTGLTDEIKGNGVTTDRNAVSLPSNDYFHRQIGQISWVASGQLIFAPLRGKVSLFQKVFVDTDFNISLGVAAVGVEERANMNTQGEGLCGAAPQMPENPNPADPCIASQLARTSRVAIAATFGAGLSFYFNEFLALTVEWRGLPFKWNTSGTDERGRGPGNDFPDGRIDSQDRVRHFNQMVNIGLAIYLPTSANLTE